MPSILNQDPGIATLQVALLILLLVLVITAGHLLAALILKACRKKKPAPSAKAQEIARTIARIKKAEASKDVLPHG